MSRNLKRTILILLDAFIIQIAHVSSYFFLYPLVDIEPRPFFMQLFLLIFTYIVFGYFGKVFDKINRFTGIKDTLVHVAIITVSFVFSSLVYITFAYLISVSVIPASRIVWRLWVDHQRRVQNSVNSKDKPIRTLLIGAGDAGAIFVRSLRNRPDINVVGFLDDDRNKQNTV